MLMINDKNYWRQAHMYNRPVDVPSAQERMLAQGWIPTPNGPVRKEEFVAGLLGGTVSAGAGGGGSRSSSGQSTPSDGVGQAFDNLQPDQQRRNGSGMVSTALPSMVGGGFTPAAGVGGLQGIIQRGIQRGETDGRGIVDFNDNITNRPLPGASNPNWRAERVIPGPGRSGTMSAEYDRYMGYNWGMKPDDRGILRFGM